MKDSGVLVAEALVVAVFLVSLIGFIVTVFRNNAEPLAFAVVMCLSAYIGLWLAFCFRDH